jgi:hypothetical protein
MSEEKHHHLFHHKKEGEEFEPAADGGVNEYAYTSETVVAATDDGEYARITKEEKHHKHKEHLGEMGAVTAGAFALVRIHPPHHLNQFENFGFYVVQHN